ncbi:MAG: DUF4396 domain-containing protein [Paracoccaceae bacterium]
MSDHSQHQSPSLNRLALSATLHCLTGCGIGEVLGLVIGTSLGWGTVATIALAVVLAFFFGYLMTLVPLLCPKKPMGRAMRVALAADSVSITVMEIIDNAVILAVPGAMAAGLASWLFWISLAFALIVAAFVVFPVNRWMIARGRGHAVVHGHH